MVDVWGTSVSETLIELDGVTNGDDRFGLGGDDYILGGSGADDIDGGSDHDTADYSSSAQGVIVSLVSGTGPAMAAPARPTTSSGSSSPMTSSSCRERRTAGGHRLGGRVLTMASTQGGSSHGIHPWQ